MGILTYKQALDFMRADEMAALMSEPFYVVKEDSDVFKADHYFKKDGEPLRATAIFVAPLSAFKGFPIRFEVVGNYE